MEKVDFKYICPECKIIQSSRAKHCYYCRECIERYDHHCEWVNNCIGIRNHWMFFFFVLFIFINLTIVITLAFYQLFVELGV